jgi:hypothetical protein
MENRILKAKQIKKVLQMRTNVKKEMVKLNIGMCEEKNYRSMQVSDEELRMLSRIFNLPIIKAKDYDHYTGEIYIEGVRIYSYKYDFDYSKKLDWTTSRLKKRLKELFFETEDKIKAFEKMKEEEKELCETNYTGEKYSWINKYKTLEEFERHLNRAEKKTYEQIWQEYLSYKTHWEKCDEDVTYGNYDKLRPMHDYYSPATFKEWYKFKY